MKLADRRGNIEECSSGQDRLLEWIYTHETGRFLMKGLINPHISEIGAAFLDSRASRVLIAWFIRKNKIPMYQYEQKKYRSFNEFFKRKALPGARRIIREPVPMRQGLTISRPLTLTEKPCIPIIRRLEHFADSA